MSLVKFLFKHIELLVLGLVVLSLCIIGITYSYLAYSYQDDVAIKGNVVNVDAELQVERVVGSNVGMVPLISSHLNNAINGVGSDNGACVDANGNLACQVYKITITNKGVKLDHLRGIIELYSTDTGKYQNLKWQELTNTTTIKEGSAVNGMDRALLVSDLTLNVKEEKIFYIAVWISEEDVDQTSIDKGSFGGTVTFETYNGTAADTIINLYNDGSTIETVYIGGSSSNPQVNLNYFQRIMLDNNGDYRYYGADPNNYVTFNGEIWRIIGLFNNIDDGTGKKETRLKIIRKNSIGEYSYDSSPSSVNEGYGVNDWSKADLNTELNSLYYNSTSGTCYIGPNNNSKTCDFSSTGLKSEAREMIGDAVFHLGSVSITDFAADLYLTERGTTVYDCSTDDGACPRATTWTGKVGLMYSSDYAYATDLSKCTESVNSYDAIPCYSNSWLAYPSYENDELIISPYRFNRNRVAYIYRYSNGKGEVGSSYASAYSLVRPVVYLKSNVAIVSGEGRSSNPYTLKISG